MDMSLFIDGTNHPTSGPTGDNLAYLGSSQYEVLFGLGTVPPVQTTAPERHTLSIVSHDILILALILDLEHDNPANRNAVWIPNLCLYPKRLFPSYRQYSGVQILIPITEGLIQHNHLRRQHADCSSSTNPI